VISTRYTRNFWLLGGCGGSAGGGGPPLSPIFGRGKGEACNLSGVGVQRRKHTIMQQLNPSMSLYVSPSSVTENVDRTIKQTSRHHHHACDPLKIGAPADRAQDRAVRPLRKDTPLPPLPLGRSSSPPRRARWYVPGPPSLASPTFTSSSSSPWSALMRHQNSSAPNLKLPPRSTQMPIRNRTQRQPKSRKRSTQSQTRCTRTSKRSRSVGNG